MATIIVRRPRRERMEQQAPEEMAMSRDEMPKGAFDPTFPSELEGLIPPEEWAQIVDRLDEFWVPFFKREQEIEGCAMCLCCCCCCTLGLSLCAMCCYSSCAGRKLDKRKIEGRRQMKVYFEEELNPKYSDKGVRFAVAPTIKTFYVEIRINKEGYEDNRSRADSTTDEEKEGEPLLRRAKEDHASNGGASSSTTAGQSSSSAAPAPTYGTQPADIDIDPSADGLDGLD
jgi:hypothetical protein